MGDVNSLCCHQLNCLWIQGARSNSSAVELESLQSQGIDISHQTSKYLNQILDLENYQIFVSLCKEAEAAFPPPPSKMISIHWEIEDPSRVKGSEEEIQAAYEKTFQTLELNIRDLVEAILGNEFLK